MTAQTSACLGVALRELAEEHLATLERIRKRFQLQHEQAIALSEGEPMQRGFLAEIEALELAIEAVRARLGL